VYAHGADLLLVAALQEREEVVDVAVDVPVGEEPDQVQGLAALARPVGELAPDRALEDAAAGDRGLDELCALVEDAPAAERIVTYLAVAHVVVAGHADRGAVGIERGRQGVLSEPVEIRRAGQPDGVGLVPAADPDAVEDARYHRPRDAGEARSSLQLPVHAWLPGNR
jgi:hypothetical protein